MRHERFHRGAVLTLLMGMLAAGGGCATHRTHPYAEFDPPIKGAIVLANDIVVKDPLLVSKPKKEKLRWVSFPGTTLTITFDEDPLPFRVHCQRNQCQSEPVDGSANHKVYAYHATVTGGLPDPEFPARAKAPSDPKVIIEY